MEGNEKAAKETSKAAIEICITKAIPNTGMMQLKSCNLEWTAKDLIVTP